MDKQDIINYVTRTPLNTNKAILDEMLDEFAKEHGTGGGELPQYVILDGGLIV